MSLENFGISSFELASNDLQQRLRSKDVIDSENREISLERQRIRRRQNSQRKFIENKERQAIAQFNNTSDRREIRRQAQIIQDSIRSRADLERGRLEEGIIYNSIQHEEPTDNNQGASESATSGSDVISSESSPGDSTGSGPGGNAPVTVPDQDDDDSTEFSEQTLDIVNSDNTAGQKIFLTKSV
tara:strand:+ start:39 stop:593 length:555 start_codon:yes stop_codon:yes gene_type:complete